MANLADVIEGYLKELLGQKEGVLELQRCDLAGQFGCAPSQINYVLATRFNPQRGYLVESRRGGGGYIRIIRLNVQENLHEYVHQKIGDVIAQDEAVGIIRRLEEEGVLTDRERLLMEAAVNREAIGLPLPHRDMVRANLLKSMLITVLRF